MALSNDLISQFVKVTKDEKNTKTESIVYGTTKEYNGKMYVKFDGSELLTPVSTTADIKDGERVTVMIKNHSATVTGNVSSPSARSGDVHTITGDVSDINLQITELRADTVGMNKVPEIPANADLNNYTETGCYAVYRNDNAETIANIPVARAGRLEVWSATGEGVQSEQWSYLRQRYIPYNSENAVWERDVARGEDNVWIYHNWYKSTLTPAAASKVYHEQKVLWEGSFYMSAEHTINLSEAVSAQPNGIVLVFSKYDASAGTASDDNFNSFFVPKGFIVDHNGYGNAFTMADTNFDQICHKYLYINDTYITGHANNVATGTGASGITYANDKYVLRYVYGV